MKWIITKDNITGGEGDLPSRVGRCNFQPTTPEKDIPKPHVRFRLKDDDGEVYYEGICNKAEFDAADEEGAFGPLDWAMNDAGCTIMETRDGNGPWTRL